MKKIILYFAAATALCTPVAAKDADVAAAAPTVEAIHGVWVREGHPDDKLEFYDCTGKLCAKGILPMLNGSPPPLVLRNAVKTTPSHWKGDLFNPENGKLYTGKISLDSPDQLTLTGCLIAFLCQSETWTRVPKNMIPATAKTPAQPKTPAPAQAKTPAPPQAKTPTSH